MTTPLRETALAAIATRLAAQITTAAVERARRGPVDTDKETLPRLILTGADWAADEAAEPGIVHYSLGFAVTGFARAKTDLALEQALSALHAQVIAALAGWTPTAAGLGEPSEQDAEFRLYDADESAKPAGEFTARFTVLITAALGNPY